jgi:hypothetical protein
MAVELGVLLGAYGGGQSFENVGSWAAATTQCSLSLQASDVHSSGSGGRLQVFSGATGSVRYDYAQADDAYARWNLDVTTHRVVGYGWARVDATVWSGRFTAVFTAGSVPIPQADTLQPIRIEAQTCSGAAGALGFQVPGGLTGSGTLYMDDMLVAADVLDLQATWDTQQLRQGLLAQHSTLGGRDAFYAWHERPRFSLPLPAVPSSAMDVLNRWWREAWPLLFVFDSSDTSARFVVRIAGSEPPAKTVRYPYFDQGQVVLTLEGLHGGLDF